MDWSPEEVEHVVRDYLEMLAAYFAGQPVKKAERRRTLQKMLNGRNDSSIERKRANISAVVERLGFHHLPGYKPLWNYQRLLDAVVAEQIEAADWLDDAALAAVQMPAVRQVHTDFSKVKADPPRVQLRVRERTPSFEAIRRDYLEREARNRSLGKAGEEFVVEYEKWRLAAFGENGLSQKVDWVSSTRGDGLGFDVQSFEVDGTVRLIEVKTTAFGIATPFFLSDVELKFAQLNAGHFHLYRLYQFRHQPKLFSLVGNPSDHCLLDPISYRASFN